MFLSKLIVTLIIVSLIECRSSSSDPEGLEDQKMLEPERSQKVPKAKRPLRKYQKVKNVTVVEGEDGYLGCLNERNDFNPYYIQWSYGKHPGSLRQIESEEVIYDYPLDRVSKDQAGFYACKFRGGKKPGWTKLFHLTVKGKCLISPLYQRTNVPMYQHTNVSTYQRNNVLLDIDRSPSETYIIVQLGDGR